MKKHRFFFLSIFFLVYALNNCAMEKRIIQSNITQYEMPHSTYAIAPLSNNQIFAFDCTSYSFLNVEKGKIEIVSKKKLYIELYPDIFVHPQGNIIGMFGKKGIHLFSHHDL